MSHLVILRESGYEAHLSQAHESGVLVFSLELEQSDFDVANELLNEETSTEVFSTDLSQYSNEELRQIVAEASDYAPSFVQIVLAELDSRGISDQVSFDEAQFKHEQQLTEEVKEGKRLSPVWLIVGFLSALGGGVLGIGIGWTVEVGKTKAPDGNTYYTYDNTSRYYGKRIKWAGIVFLIFWLMLSFYLQIPK